MKIVIVGLGVIGASFAQGLTQAGVKEVYGIDINQDTLQKAKTAGMIKEGYIRPSEILPQADLVMLTLYPNQVADFVKKNQGHFKPRAVLTDVTGIKTSIIKEVMEVLPEDNDFVFAHPMRGSEKVGIIGADYKKFLGANALITPIPTNKKESLDLVERLYRRVGFTVISYVSPEEHDEQIAYVSQLMHVLSVAAVNSEADKEINLFAGDSFKELTRIASINGPLWTELFMGNKDYLIGAIERFEDELARIKEAVNHENYEQLQDIFKKSTNRRDGWFKD